jgi:predicted nucleic acid-binding protein
VIVVSDASPLITLAGVGQLHLLHALYGEVLIPSAIWDEVVHDGRPGVQDVLSATWIRIVQVAQDSYLMALQTDLDDGEAEALALAADVKADVVLLDERRGREVALWMGFRVIGAAGVLVQAKAHGLLAEIRPVLDEMLKVTQFRLARHLYDALLRDAGED